MDMMKGVHIQRDLKNVESIRGYYEDILESINPRFKNLYVDEKWLGMEKVDDPM